MPTLYQKMDQRSLTAWRAKRKEAWERLSPEFRTPRQILGQRQTIGCVALEITQRCNLDCTYCYLSDMSESVPDLPLDEVKRRADLIVRDWGPNTNVQITGGDPTMRKRSELIEIVRYCSSIGLFPALFTNGIKAKRPLLEELAAVGLVDVAFHVDITQERRKPRAGRLYESEAELNEVREEYIERVRGLSVAVVFNTTVCPQNIEEVPDLIRFFRRNSDVVGMCSFQMGADTGRGIERGRALTHESMRATIDEAFDRPLMWNPVDFGHPKCHSIAYTFQCEGGESFIDFGEDMEMLEASIREAPEYEMDRRVPARVIYQSVKTTLSNPTLRKLGTRWTVNTLRNHWRKLLRSKGRVNKLSIFIQNFMDASDLDAERVANCSFMVATHEGTISMCLHNARRNEFILHGVDTLIRKPVKRGRDVVEQPSLPRELTGPVTPGAAGLPEELVSKGDTHTADPELAAT